MRTALRPIAITGLTLCLAGCFHSQVDVADLIARARAFKDQGELAKARVELNEAVTKNPRSVEANLELAKIEEQQGDLQDAVPHYLVAAAPEAHLIEPQLHVAELLLDSNRFADATGRLNSTLSSFPGNPDVLALRADLEQRQGQTTTARADADAALQKDRTNPRALAVKATSSLEDNNGAGALALVDQGLAQHPDDLRLLQVRAAALVAQNRPVEAADALRAVIRLAPHSVGVQVALAKLEASNGRADPAVSAFKASAESDPSNPALQLAFVDFLASLNRGEDVVATLNRLIKANPTSNTYDLALAQYLGNTDRWSDASSVLARAAERLREGSAYDGVAVAQARLDAQQGRIDLALSKVEAALKAEPDDESALMLRASLNMDGGRIPAAREDLLHVVRVDPVNATAYQILANGYLATGDAKLAVDAMQRAVAVAPGNLDAQLRLAAFLQEAGASKASQELATRLTLQFPRTQSVWLMNGELGIARKDWTAVSQSLSKLREMPEASSATQALDARAKAARGDVAGAASSFQQAIASDPNTSPSAISAYAQASAALGEAGQAADFLAQHAPTFKGRALAQLWVSVMELRADAGHVDGTADAFNRAAAAAPRDGETYKRYVDILLARQDYQGARAVVNAGLAAGAPRGAMLFLLGEISEQSGDQAAALKAYGDVLAIDPLFVQALNNYGSVLADAQPKNTPALERARESLKGVEQGNDPYKLDTVAWLDYRLGRFDEAREILTRADAANSPNPVLRFHLAAVLLAAGDRAGGMALLKTTEGLKFAGSEEAKALSNT